MSEVGWSTEALEGPYLSGDAPWSSYRHVANAASVEAGFEGRENLWIVADDMTAAAPTETFVKSPDSETRFAPTGREIFVGIDECGHYSIGNGRNRGKRRM